jgi:hypothetical protein
MEQYAVARDLEAQEWRRLGEEHQVDFAARRPTELRFDLNACSGGIRVEQNAQVDVATSTGFPARRRTEEHGEPDGGEAGGPGTETVEKLHF